MAKDQLSVLQLWQTRCVLLLCFRRLYQELLQLNTEEETEFRGSTTATAVYKKEPDRPCNQWSRWYSSTADRPLAHH